MLDKMIKIINGSGETKFTCKRCGKVWYVTAKEMREYKKIKNDTNGKIANANLGKVFSLSISKHSRINAEVAQMKATQQMLKEYDRCPECGSKNVEREFAD